MNALTLLTHTCFEPYKIEIDLFDLYTESLYLKRNTTQRLHAALTSSN